MEFRLPRTLRTLYLNLLKHVVLILSLHHALVCGIARDLANELPDKLAASRPAEGEFRQFDVTFIRVLSNGSQVDSTLRLEGGHMTKITVKFTAFHEHFKLILELNRKLFSANYIEKRVHSNGQENHNSVSDQDSVCYYSGTVEGHPGSTAGLSTCSGIRGYVVTEVDGYHIEPKQPTLLGEHFIFRDSDSVSSNWSCGQQQVASRLSSVESRKMRRSLRWPYDANDKTMIVELYVANDHSQLVRFRQNADEVIRRTKDIVNIVSSLYRPLNIYVALVGVEVWMDKNEIEIVENADKTMNNFLEYRRQHISPRHPNDNAQLITGQALGDGVVGKAPIMTICTWQYSGGVNLDHSTLVGPVATTVAHEMGHNFGLTHDTETCGCPDDRCIMAPSSGGLKNPTKWSECSKQQFADAFHQGMDYCLHNLPLQLKGGAICGNGFTEDGEQCDCGLPQDCTNTCCNATTCRLLPNATCAMGECCDQSTCQPKPVATECRKSVGGCDLAEYCSGLSEFCPADVFKQEGTDCSLDGVDSYCYRGRCESHDNQCKLLWGRTGRVSNRLCFEHFNIMGTANGHCGFNWVDGKSFKKCELRDAMCGMLHCRHRNEKLMFWKEALAYALPEAWVMANSTRQDCKGVILDVGLDMPDPGMVPDGAKCGEKKICIKQQCRDIGNLGLQKCPDCNGHGVCNSVGQCHCDAGYAPPFCDRAGNGGSKHSGPISIFRTNVGLIIGMCLLFLVIIPLLTLLAFCGYRNHEKIKCFWLAQQSDKYRSVYRANPRNDTERPPRSTIVQPGYHPPPPAKMPANGDWIRPPSVAVVGTSVPPCRPVEMKRSPNFRPQDMSSPRYHNPSCNLPMVPIAKQKMTNDNSDMVAMENRAGMGPACTVDDDKLVPTRMAPAPPASVSKRHRDLGYVPDVVPNGFVTPKKPPKRPPLPQDSRTPQKVLKASSMSGSKPSHFVGSETSCAEAGGGGVRDHEESSKIGGSPTVPPPEPPDSRHRFYSTHHAKSVVGQGPGVVVSPGNPHLAANSNHAVSHRRNKLDMRRLEMQEDGTGNGRDPAPTGRQSSEKSRESKSGPPHKKGPSLITQESIGAMNCPPAISGHQATTTTGSALRSQRC